MGDITLLVNALFYLQYKGGGIGVVAMFSDIPYFIMDTAAHELPFKGRNACLWATENQSRYFSNNYDEFIDNFKSLDFSKINL